MGQKIKEEAQTWPASGGSPEAHLAAHLGATQCMRGGWLPWRGCPPVAHQGAFGAMFRECGQTTASAIVSVLWIFGELMNAM